ncbi:nuclear transport factor 2 family protein [Algoriphagus mannitolivorans]|uniref:nuclear transport factor 2 family protein n=1 Tax=Algoriphagus mannitolivorans TaxID=226504 RepID=UPI0003FA037E|nr:nuclear transport factor 2 family protein [Algoriphagus mannitolivorans]
MKLFLLMNGGHSPKGKLIQDLSISFASYDLERLEPFLAEDITWTLIGDTPIKGKANFLAALGEMMGNTAAELQIHQIVTHGKEGAVYGEMIMENGDRFAFADFYVFSSTRSDLVKSISSFVIQKTK